MTRWSGLALALSLAACSKGAQITHDAPPIPDAPPTCPGGPRRCEGNQLQRCGDDGQYHDAQLCEHACSPDLGCVLCVPGTGTCNSPSQSHACNDAGTGWSDVDCDPVQGLTCGPTGVCDGACAPHAIGTSYIGCEYFPTVTGNPVAQQFHFAVAVANTTEVNATITIEDGALAKADVFMVPAHGVKVEILPWQAALKLCMKDTNDECGLGVQAEGALVARGAYHLRSTVPVTVYQFNPLEYRNVGSSTAYSATNDASLLFPATAWRAAYLAASWPPVATGYNPGELAVTARNNGTRVTITTRADTKAGGGAPAFKAGVAQTVTLDAGGVLEITSRTGDLTGSTVTADGPIQVIAGHYAADVPVSVDFSDHLEESMFPIDALGAKYVVTSPDVWTHTTVLPQIVRIIAVSDDTHLSYDPPQPGAPATIAHGGEFVEIASSTASYVVTSDRKIMVAQYMEGSQATDDKTGDPSLALAVPVDQFRKEYLFHAPVNYDSNYVDVVAPVGATVTLDGKPVTLVPIATTGFALARVSPLEDGPAMDGNHSISGNQPFGITVYGYGKDTSYWYPGGLELHEIVVN